MASHILDFAAPNELNSPETKVLFDIVDQLSPQGLGKIANLPQIIVVGDRSSGKSTVLEAISNARLPGTVANGRFTTEVILRRGVHQSVTATIQFADNTKSPHSLKLTNINPTGMDEFKAEIGKQMGLSQLGSNFSLDILRLEIEGPGLYPLTLVDLPGLVPSAASTQPTEEETNMMHLVESYMENPRSIILAVISAENELEGQSIMKETAKYDPARQRTLGVITKPDLIHPGSQKETEYLKLAKSREAARNLGLGWHLMCNRKDDEDLDPREFVEDAFFESGAWSSVPVCDRGVRALQAKLRRVLHGHIKSGVPALLEDIQENISDREVELDRLGESKDTPQGMRVYLINIAERFQKLARDGIRGHYDDPFFGGFNGTHRKLRSQLRDLNRALRHVLVTLGSAQLVMGRPNAGPPQYATPAYLEELLQTYTDEVPCPEIVAWANLSSQLKTQSAASQGTHLPPFVNMDIVMQLFQKQSAPWKRIVEIHIEKVMDTVKAFVDEALEEIVGPHGSNSTTSTILSTCVDPFFDKKEDLLSEKLEELLRPYKEGYALPIETDFREALERKITKRTTPQAGEVAVSAQQSHLPAIPPVSHWDGADVIFDTMETFYDAALRTFTDNVINLAIESCLIQDLPSIFTPRLVNGMTDDEVSHIAMESDDIGSYRDALEEDIKQLKQGLEVCRRFRPRAAAAKSRCAKKSIYKSRTASTPTSVLGDFGVTAAVTQPQTVQLPFRQIQEIQKPKAAVSEAPSSTGLFGTSTAVPGLSTSATAPLAPSAAEGTNEFAFRNPVTGSIYSSGTPPESKQEIASRKIKNARGASSAFESSPSVLNGERPVSGGIFDNLGQDSISGKVWGDSFKESFKPRSPAPKTASGNRTRTDHPSASLQSLAK